MTSFSLICNIVHMQNIKSSKIHKDSQSSLQAGGRLFILLTCEYSLFFTFITIWKNLLIGRLVNVIFRMKILLLRYFGLYSVLKFLLKTPCFSLSHKGNTNCSMSGIKKWKYSNNINISNNNTNSYNNNNTTTNSSSS